MDELFTQEDLLALAKGVTGDGSVNKVHPTHNRKIALYYREDEEGNDEALLFVSGGDLPPNFSEWVQCNFDLSAVNWIADALGRAPAPKQ